MSTDLLSRDRGPSPLIDPRLRDRRIEVARDQGRRRLRRVMVLVGLVAVIAGSVAVTRSPLLDVDRIEVRGTGERTADSARLASGLVVGDPLVAIDAEDAAQRIEELAWVEAATVSRSWPSTVVVRITERVPVAQVGTGRAARLVDADGRVLGPTGDRTELPVLSGPVAQVGDELSGPRRQVAAIVGALPDDLRSELAVAKATDAGVVFELTDGIRVRWGDDSQPTAKADALRTLLEQDDRDTFGSIDVSVPRATTVMPDTGGR